MLRIWGRLSSINVQKVVWCARELHLDHERVDIGVNKGDLDTEAYVRLNPNRQIPVIEDFRGTDVGGEPFVLWESNAIVRYLCARYGEGTLWPEDVKARAHSVLRHRITLSPELEVEGRSADDVLAALLLRIEAPK